MAKTYWEKLKDPRWQKKRLEIMQRDEFKCGRCNRSDVTLSVHHRIYRKNCEPWEYTDEDLTTLCQPCHSTITDQDSLIKEWLSCDENRLFILRFMELEDCGLPNVESAMWAFQDMVTHYLGLVFKDGVHFGEYVEIERLIGESILAIDATSTCIGAIQQSIMERLDRMKPKSEPENAPTEAADDPELDPSKPF
jgi:hypothetical protein